MTTSTAVNDSKTKAFTIIFFLEFWERFGYYGLIAIMTLFFVQSLHMSDDQAVMTYGAFGALCYGLTAIGGMIGDKYLGAKRTIIVGALFLTAGYFVLSMSGESITIVFAGLATIAVGNGFFKANPSSMVSKIYSGDPSKVESAFTIYYMAINIGSFLSVMLTPWTSKMWGHGASYLICAIGLIIAIINLIGGYGLLKSYDSPAGMKKFQLSRLLICVFGGVAMIGIGTMLLSNLTVCNWIVAIVGAVALAYFVYEIAKSRGLEQRKMIVALILMLEAVVFFTLYNQMPTSINLFSIRNTNHAILFGALSMDPQQFQTFNPFWIMILSPILAWLYNYMGNRGTNVSMPWKFAGGMLLCAGAFYILSFSALFASNGLVSGDWVLVSYLLQSFGELLISGLGLAMVAQLVPARMQGFIMGVWFLSNTAASILGGMVASFASIPKDVTNPVETLSIYVGVFNKIGMVTLIIFVVIAIASPWLTRMIKVRAGE